MYRTIFFLLAVLLHVGGLSLIFLSSDAAMIHGSQQATVKKSQHMALVKFAQQMPEIATAKPEEQASIQNTAEQEIVENELKTDQLVENLPEEIIDQSRLEKETSEPKVLVSENLASENLEPEINEEALDEPAFANEDIFDQASTEAEHVESIIEPTIKPLSIEDISVLSPAINQSNVAETIKPEVIKKPSAVQQKKHQKVKVQQDNKLDNRSDKVVKKIIDNVASNKNKLINKNPIKPKETVKAESLTEEKITNKNRGLVSQVAHNKQVIIEEKPTNEKTLIEEGQRRNQLAAAAVNNNKVEKKQAEESSQPNNQNTGEKHVLNTQSDKVSNKEKHWKNYLEEVRGRIVSQKVYPKQARLRKQEGIVKVEFVISAQGLVTDYSLLKKTNSKHINTSVHTLFSKLKLPTPSQKVSSHLPVKLTIPLHYSLTNKNVNSDLITTSKN